MERWEAAGRDLKGWGFQPNVIDEGEFGAQEAGGRLGIWPGCGEGL